MTHRCRVAGTNAQRKPLRMCNCRYSAGPCNGAPAVQFAGMVEFGLKRIAGVKQMPKTVILLAAFHAEYPGIGQEITRFMLDNDGESVLKDFLFEILNEVQKGE